MNDFSGIGPAVSFGLAFAMVGGILILLWRHGPKKLRTGLSVTAVLAVLAVMAFGIFSGRISASRVKRLIFGRTETRVETPPPATVRVTIPEGYTVRDICALLAAKGVATEEELLDAAKTAGFEFSFVDNVSDSISRLEGYLFPDTYDFYTPEDPAHALGRLLNNFSGKMENWKEELSGAEERGYDLRKIVIIASLIEKETDGTDYARIASVIYNRLDGPGNRAGTYGLLQIDASVIYGIPGHTGPLTRDELESDSPYNLYKNTGLPPTAIASPGARSLLAAMSPEETDFYYYALAKDGKHRFFSTYREFSAFLNGSEFVNN